MLYKKTERTKERVRERETENGEIGKVLADVICLGHSILM